MSVNRRYRFLIWGGRGWIAGLLKDLLTEMNLEVESTTVRMENREEVRAVIECVQPTHVFNCAGSTGRPNVDWCEDHKQAVLRNNVIGTLNLADICCQAGVHCTVFATGCIYAYDQAHPTFGPGFKETDLANFHGSFYSKMLECYRCLVLRLRMPVSDDLNPRSFVTKLVNYARVVDVPNSHTILHDLLPAAVKLAQHDEVGTYNFTNPGAASHNEVLALYKKYIMPDFSWTNFSVEEQSLILMAQRSNCKLDSAKLVAKMREYDYRIPEIHDAYARCFQRMAKNLKPAGEEAGGETTSVDSGAAV